MVDEGGCLGLLSHSSTSHTPAPPLYSGAVTSPRWKGGSELKKHWAVVNRSISSTWWVLEETCSKPLVLKSSLCAWVIAAVGEDLPLGSSLQLSPLCCTTQPASRVLSWTSMSNSGKTTSLLPCYKIKCALLSACEKLGQPIVLVAYTSATVLLLTPTK